jgi:hypothetical protein
MSFNIPVSAASDSGMIHANTGNSAAEGEYAQIAPNASAPTTQQHPRRSRRPDFAFANRSTASPQKPTRLIRNLCATVLAVVGGLRQNCWEAPHVF